MKTINIGLLGCGTVGTGVAKLLLENRQLIQSRVGVPLHLKYVADIDLEKARGLDFQNTILTSDANQVINDPQVDIIIEMIGGENIAKDLILKAIESGRPVVTANKALLAKHGNVIFETAHRKGVDLAFEASVGGCMPIIKTIRESLVGNHIKSMIGILNGTCNYILSKITDEGISFQTVLKEAQAEGYAEADPTLDVDGLDTAHKLAILSTLAYGTQINFDDIYIEGISQITPMDIEFAGEFGYRVKLLAIGKDRGNAIEARVHPTMIPFDNLLSNVNGTVNAVTVSGDAVQDILLYGRGAGMMPTASAVISDLADIARNLISGATKRLPLLSFQPDSMRQIPVMSIDDIATHYYFRFFALDRPGVLSKISGSLGNHNISIKSVHQRGRKSNGSVPVVMVTHRAKESDVKQAFREIETLDVVSATPLLIRIEDQREQD